MGQRRNAESVRNFVIFLLILQNCGQARTHPEIEPESEPEPEPEQMQKPDLQQRRDGLAKFEFSGKQPVKGVAPVAPLNVFNFAKIYETFYAQLMQTTAAAELPGHGRQHGSGRDLRNPLQAQLMWQTPSDGDEQVVLVTSPKPFHLVEQLHQDLEEKRKHTTTVKPFSTILQQLAMEQAEQLRQKRPNVSFNILEALQMEQDKWEKQTSTVKPFRVVQQLQQELEELRKQTTTVKPFSVLQQLALQQAEELRKKKTPNVSFNLLNSLHKEQESLDKQKTTVKPFHLVEQLTQELEKHEAEEEEQEEAFEVLQPVAEPLEQHKAVPAESSRAKGSQKRKRKRIQRRRKRKRKRGKRKRRRNRKKRKKKRKKRKKKKGDKDKKKKRKKRRKKPTEATGNIIGQQAHLIYANPTKQPYHSHNSPYPHPQQPQLQPQLIQIVTTKRPATNQAPFSKIKYLLRHNSLFKKKKKEWFNHVGHVLYPLIKFVAFFTVLNPFTLGVFLFTLISPAVFGFLGFVALSVLVKPFLHLVFGVKANVDAIDRKRYLANKRAQQLKLNLRPVTIHKHYYQQKPLHSTPPHRYRPVVDWRRRTTERRHNPLLPADRAALEQL